MSVIQCPESCDSEFLGHIHYQGPLLLAGKADGAKRSVIPRTSCCPSTQQGIKDSSAIWRVFDSCVLKSRAWKDLFIACMLPAGTLIVTGFVLNAFCIYSPDSSDCIFSTVLYIALTDLLVLWLFSLLLCSKLSGLLETINTRYRFRSTTDCRSNCTITNRWQSLLYLQLHRKGEGASGSVSTISASALSFAISNSDWSSMCNLLTNH